MTRYAVPTKLLMTNSLLSWHLSRDNQIELSKFCDRYQIERKVSKYYQVGRQKCFTHTTYFSNGSWIKAEMVQGLSIVDHYQVVDYKMGII